MNNKYKALSQNLIEKYKRNLLTENDLKLLTLFFSENPTQAKLDEFLSNYDIEVAGGYKALMLSYFMRMHPDLNFTSYETPRLKGLFNFYRFQNMKLFSYLIKIGKVFNENNIPMLALKGFSMKVLRPELARAMGDIDVLVPENKFVKAIEICKKLGYRLDIFVHSIDVHEPSSNAGVMDIHRFIDMQNRRERPLNKYLFKRAVKSSFNGVDILVPSNEDLLFLALINLAKNMKEKTSKASTLYVLFDCKFLMSKPDFDWNIVIKNIKLTKSEEHVAFACGFINSIIPNLIPKELAEHKLIKNKIDDYCIKILFDMRFFPALQKVIRRVKLKSALKKEISLITFIKNRIYYKFCKYLSQYHIAVLKRIILEQRERNKSYAHR